MNAPHSYAEWLPLLDRFAAGDDSTLEVMQKGSIEWTAVVSERWTRQMEAALTTRLQSLEKLLQKNLDRATMAGDYFAISNALLQARRGLTPLRTFVNMPALPANVRDHLVSELNRWAREKQKNLESFAETIRHDQGRYLKTFRDHNLNVVVEAPVPSPSDRDSSPSPPPVRGRRVIL